MTTLTSPSSVHDTTCSECGNLYSCTCNVAERHQERLERGWVNPCPACNAAMQRGWIDWLNTLPEREVREPVPEYGSWKR